jgi:hypothetical protein
MMIAIVARVASPPIRPAIVSSLQLMILIHIQTIIKNAIAEKKPAIAISFPDRMLSALSRRPLKSDRASSRMLQAISRGLGATFA